MTRSPLATRTQELGRHSEEAWYPRVEDTIYLLAHAVFKIVTHVAKLRDRPTELVVDELGVPLLAAPNIKSGLDVD